MMQSQWSGLAARTFDPTPLALAGPDDLAAMAPNRITGLATGIAPQRSGLGDGITRPWWGQPSTDAGWQSGLNGTLPGANGAILGLVQSLIGAIQQLLSSLFTGNGSSGGPYGAGDDGAQRFQDVDISSTGDPHIAETGTRQTRDGQRTVDQRYDSMSSHPDLVDSHDIAGGYRVSTTVTQPAANGVTYNQSATVDADYGQDAITMNKDGSFAISDRGVAVALVKGQSVGLSGGEVVTENQDGSLTVNDGNTRGGSISTTLRATGSGVDVTTHGHEIALGGDVVQHASGGA
jgi:hypothetical protein